MAISKYILSIDGGGIRGMIPLYTLQELEEQTGKQARDIFSFMAGTSTGSIIVSALALGMPAKEIVRLYREKAGDIFRGGLPTQGLEWLSRVYGECARLPWLLGKSFDRLSAYSDVATRLRGYKYPSEGIRRFVSQALSEHTGRNADQIILDDLDMDILITAQGVQDGHTWYFVKTKARDWETQPGDESAPPSRKYRTTGQLKLVDCVVGSSSAPTYFSPHLIDELVGRDERRIGIVADGGVTTANNPVYQACVEAFDHTPEHGYRPNNTLVISLGTGRRPENQLVHVPSDLVDWLEWSFGNLLEAPGKQQLEFVARHFPKTPLYRIDVPLREQIDLADPHAIGTLEAYGRELAGQLREDRDNWQAILRGRHNRWRFGRGRGNSRKYDPSNFFRFNQNIKPA